MTVTRGSIDTRMFNAINEKTKQIWFQTGNSPTGETGIHLAGGISNTTFSTSTPNTWGYNTFIANGGLKLRYNQIDLTTLSTNALTFYRPNVTSGAISGSVKAMELGTSALTFYSPSSTDNNNLKKLMELTNNSLNFYNKDDSINPIAQYNSSGVLLGKVNVNNSYNTLINSNGLTIRQNISGTQKNLAQFYGTGFAFTNTNNDNIISGGSVSSSQVYQYIYNEKTISGTVPKGQTNYILHIKFPEYTGSSTSFNGIGISSLGITVGSQGDERHQRRYVMGETWEDFSNVINVQLRADWSVTDEMPILDVKFINYAGQNYTISFLKYSMGDDPPENIHAYYIMYTKPASANLIIGTQGRLPDHAVGTGMVRYNSNGSNAISEWVIDAAGNTFIKDLYLNNHSGPIGTLTQKTSNANFPWSDAADKWVNHDEPQLYLTPGTYVITASARIDTGSGNSGKFGICIGYSTSDGAWKRDMDSRVVYYNNQTYMLLTTTVGISIDTSAFFSPFYYASNNNTVKATYQTIRAVRIC